MYRIDADPTEALPPGVAEDGSFLLRTGDRICDEWEKEISKTGSFNPFKQMSAEDAEAARKFLENIGNEMTELPERLKKR